MGHSEDITSDMHENYHTSTGDKIILGSTYESFRDNYLKENVRRFRFWDYVHTVYTHGLVQYMKRKSISAPVLFLTSNIIEERAAAWG